MKTKSKFGQIPENFYESDVNLDTKPKYEVREKVKIDKFPRGTEGIIKQQLETKDGWKYMVRKTSQPGIPGNIVKTVHEKEINV